MAANQRIWVKEGDVPGTLTEVEVLGTGRQAAVDSKSVVQSNEDKAVMDAMKTALDALATIVATSRANMNMIPGQVGVAANTGAADALTQRVVYASNDPIVAAISTGAAQPITGGQNMIGHIGGDEYEVVLASQTDAILGSTGAVGNYLAGFVITPLTTSPGAVSLKDGSGTAYTVFAGGASSVSNLVPFPVAWGAKCTGVGWKVTTGANVTVAAFGDFT